MREFTTKTRAEPGAVGFDWARSLEDPNEIVLIEGVHPCRRRRRPCHQRAFKAAIARLPALLSAAPQIVHADIAAAEWSTMSEFVLPEN